MRWVHNYQLILFDFDGLLVNTEEIHYQAYQQMCANRGIDLNWSFERYCNAAHYEAQAMRDQLYDAYPELYLQEPNWEILYAEKKRALHQLFSEGSVKLMPGAEKLLVLLNSLEIPRCVVTNSFSESVGILQDQLPVLKTIPRWITREHYTKQKPNSESYQKAISLFASSGDKILGFEDTPRGIKALQGTGAQPVLIAQTNYPEIPSFLERGVYHFPSLEVILDRGSLL